MSTDTETLERIAQGQREWMARIERLQHEMTDVDVTDELLRVLREAHLSTNEPTRRVVAIQRAIAAVQQSGRDA